MPLNDSTLKRIVIVIAIIGMITVTVAFGYRTYLEFFASDTTMLQQPNANRNINSRSTQFQDRRFLMSAPVVDTARSPQIITFPFIYHHRCMKGETCFYGFPFFSCSQSLI